MAGLFGRRRRPPGSPGQSAPVGPDGKKHADGTTTFGERRADDLTPEEKAAAELRGMMEGDVTLRGRPFLRQMRQYFATSPLLQADGTPVVGRDGNRVPLTLFEHVSQTLARSAILPGCTEIQAKMLLAVTTMLIGPAMVKPEVIEQPRGGDGPGSGAGDVSPPSSEEEKEAQVRRWHGVITDGIKQEMRTDRDLTAINVTTELTNEFQGKKE